VNTGIDRRQGLAWLGAAAMAPRFAHAQGAYPTKAIRVIVPFPPGGGTDVVARMFAARLSSGLGQPVVIDNRAGATGVIGTTQVAQAPPDGYTLLVGSLSSHVLAPLTSEGKASDPVRDFAPVALLAYHPMVLIAHPAVKASSLREFVALGQRADPPLFYGSIGNGSVFHFAAAEFAQLAGIRAEHVPYKGAAPAMADLLGGQTQWMFDTIQSSLPHIQKGSLKPLAVTGQSRPTLLPQVPTLAEAGYPAYKVISWVGMMAPAATPPELVERIAAETRKLSSDADSVEQARRTGTDVPPSSPAEFRRLIVTDQKRYTEQYARIHLAGK
jgi:tripartite-type tricarboxylate transporter receptor subunit TctC